MKLIIGFITIAVLCISMGCRMSNNDKLSNILLGIGLVGTVITWVVN